MAGRTTRTTGKKDARAGIGALKASAAKRWQSLWERLQRRDKWPRCWWYPLRPQVTRQAASKAVQQNYEECVATARRTMLAILGFGLFAIVVTFGTPDSSLIAPEAKIPLPFANSKIAFLGFLVAAPFLLVVLTLYLHIFDTSRRELENAYKVNSVPALFTLDHRLPRLLTDLIFYWLVPIVLAALTWKALARLWWGLPLLAVTIAVAGGLVWMQIRRRPTDGRLLKNLPLWALLMALSSVACFAAWEAYTGLVGPEAWHQDAFRRGLNLFRADLAGKWLVRADLRDADLRYASLVGANLDSARLQGADLRDSQLQDAKNLRLANLGGANLRRVQLQGADLTRAQLEGADLSLADFRGAELGSAQLQGAYLIGAELQGAYLRGAQLQGANLTKANLQGAYLAGANLKGAYLCEANVKGADFSKAETWLASFPSYYPYSDSLPAPVPTGMADLRLSPMTAEAKAHLREDLQSNITGRKLLEIVMDRLRLILRDNPSWGDEDRWRDYAAQAEDPSAKVLVGFLAKIACQDFAGHIAHGLARRALNYSGSVQSLDRRDLGELLAKRLLQENCQGVKALTDEMRARLENLVSASE